MHACICLLLGFTYVSFAHVPHTKVAIVKIYGYLCADVNKKDRCDMSRLTFAFQQLDWNDSESFQFYQICGASRITFEVECTCVGKATIWMPHACYSRG